MNAPEPLTDDDIARICDSEIRDALSFYDTSVNQDRTRALEYYRGIMRDLPSDDGWSSQVSRDVADTINTVLPGLLRIFGGSDQIGVYQPATREDVDRAAQATDYVNYVWSNDTDGYKAVYAAIFDCLLFRNGIVKAYWDASPRVETETLTGLDDPQLALLMQDKSVEVLQATPSEQVVEAFGTSQVITVYDVRIKRTISTGRLCVDGVPPEEFLKDRASRKLEEARFVAHRLQRRRSDLIRDGYDRELVDDIPSYSSSSYDTIKIAREDNNVIMGDWNNDDKSTEEVEIFECYPLIDANGDGVAERMRVVLGGNSGAMKILARQEWPDDHPFVDFVAMPEPHRWQGRSIADDVEDVQRVKTAILRNFLDNLYLSNRPQRLVVSNQIVNPDEVMEPKIGGVIRVKSPDAIRDLVVPFLGDQAIAGLNLMDQVIQRRTGISNATSALDSTALDPQTATAEQIEHDAGYAKTELMARNLAETGFKPLFRKILRIICRNQDKPRNIRLRDQWVDIDPRVWNANMDVTINIGLGTGSRERDLTMLRGIAGEQDKVIERLGPSNPVVTPKMWRDTRAKMVEAAGIKGPGQFFAEVDDKKFATWEQEKQSSAPPDPKVLEVQQRGEIAKQEAESSERRNQLDEERIRAKLEAETILARQKIESAERMEAMKIESAERMEQIRMQHEREMEAIRLAHQREIAQMGHIAAANENGAHGFPA